MWCATGYDTQVTFLWDPPCTLSNGRVQERSFVFTAEEKLVSDGHLPYMVLAKILLISLVNCTRVSPLHQQEFSESSPLFVPSDIL